MKAYRCREGEFVKMGFGQVVEKGGENEGGKGKEDVVQTFVIHILQELIHILHNQ